MNNLKRELAPLSTEAWKQIDAEATALLDAALETAPAGMPTPCAPTSPRSPRSSPGNSGK